MEEGCRNRHQRTQMKLVKLTQLELEYENFQYVGVKAEQECFVNPKYVVSIQEHRFGSELATTLGFIIIKGRPIEVLDQLENN